MAGAITHLLVADEALQQIRQTLPALDEIMASSRPFVLLGSVSPDLPYLDIIHRGQSNWADQMHYKSTDQLVRRGAVDIGGRNIVGRPDGNAELSWLAGSATNPSRSRSFAGSNG